jgi:hypothetical protein
LPDIAQKIGGEGNVCIERRLLAVLPVLGSRFFLHGKERVANLSATGAIAKGIAGILIVWVVIMATGNVHQCRTGLFPAFVCVGTRNAGEQQQVHRQYEHQPFHGIKIGDLGRVEL